MQPKVQAPQPDTNFKGCSLQQAWTCIRHSRIYTEITTYPDLVGICGLQEILEEANKVLQLKSPSQLLSYDTTFKLGDFYVSPLLFKKVTCGFTMNFDTETGDFIHYIAHWSGALDDCDNNWHKASRSSCVRQLVGLCPHTCKGTDSQPTSYPTSCHHTQICRFANAVWHVWLWFVCNCTRNSTWDYLYDQPKMRKHLYKSFQTKTMTLFPLKKERRNKERKVKTEEEILVYCHCRMPELPNTCRVQCSHCENWFHIDSCVSVPPEALQPKNNWFSNSCTWTYRLPLCSLPRLLQY